MTIGLIGGMSWESTAVYYRLLNEAARAANGGLASADILLHSVDFAEIVALQKAGRWDRCAALLAESARRLEAGGAAGHGRTQPHQHAPAGAGAGLKAPGALVGGRARRSAERPARRGHAAGS